MGDGYYVYGILWLRDAQEEVNCLPEKGIDERYPVYVVPHRDLGALVSKVSSEEFGEEEIRLRLQDDSWVESKVLIHEGVLERVMPQHPLIPMKFGTIFISEAAVVETLRQHYEEFTGLLAKVEGKEEWGVQAYLDRHRLAMAVPETSHEVRRLKEEISRKSAGVAYLLSRKLHQLMDEEVERLSLEYSQRSYDRLKHHAEDARLNQPLPREITGREEEMILNAAYLVPKENLEAFKEELGELEREYAPQGLIYRLTGPWPPHNFVALKENRANEPIVG